MATSFDSNTHQRLLTCAIRTSANRATARPRSPRGDELVRSPATLTVTCQPFQIGVAVQAVFVEAKQLAGALVVDAAFAHRGLDVGAQLPEQHLGIELDVVQHLADGVALDQRIEAGAAVVVEADVDGVGVAEQVVQVAEDLLIGADEEHARGSTASPLTL